MIPQEIVIKKREKKKLSKAEIDSFIKGIVSGEVNDSQIASFTMAVLLNKLSRKERVNLTLAMANSGKVLKYSKKITPVIDKHSTGGVGDKVSLMLAPIVACLGIYDPMVAGRGLGHTGGTIDKLESIPGYNCYPTEDKFKKVIKKVGCGIIGANDAIAPADKRIYSIRDISGTVETMDLIIPSILSKKLAAGLDCLVMDVKFGNGSMMDTKSKAKKLAKSIEEIGTGAGMPTKAILTDMNSVLGRNVGNAVEILEAIEFLQGNADKKLYKITEKLVVVMLILGKIYKSRKEARKAVYRVVFSGEALSKFQEMVSAMGGPKGLVKTPEKYLKLAKFKKEIYPEKVGKVKAMNTRNIGLAIIELGGGRTCPDQKIDHSVGFVNFCKIGDKVGRGRKPLAIVYAKTIADTNKAAKLIKKAVAIR